MDKKYSKKKHLTLKVSSDESWANYNKKEKRRYSNTNANWKEKLKELPQDEQLALFLKYALEGNKKMLKFLNENCNIDIDIKDFDGNTALMFAVKSGKSEVVDYLLKNGANVNYINNFGVSPLHLAVRKNALNLVDHLLRYGADINIEDKYNQTPLFDAIQENNAQMIRFLIDNNAYIDMQNQEGRTPLMVASFKRERQEALCELLKFGANVNATDFNGRTGLMHAINNNNGAMMDILLKAGAMINVGDNENITPLMLCAKRGNREGLRVLISRGADVLRVDNKYRTASDYAKNYGNNSCVDILIKAEKIQSSDLSQDKKVELLKEFAMHNRVQNSCQR